MKHLNGWNRRHYFSRWSPGFGFFIYPCYSRRTHYPTLEKPGSFFVFFSITDTDYSQDNRGREGTIVYSNLPLPPAKEHSDIYLQLCMWGDYHVFLIATLVFTRLLLDEICHLIELPFEWLIDDELILSFCYSDLTLETGGFELASTITLVLQANQLTKCASHPKPGSQNIAVCEKQGSATRIEWSLKIN